MEIGEIFYINFNLKYCLGMEFIAYYGELMPEGTLTSLTVVYVTHIDICGSDIGIVRHVQNTKPNGYYSA